MEIWKDIIGYEGLYQISNHGRVKSLERLVDRPNHRLLPVKEKILNPGLSGSGDRLYYAVGLCKNGKFNSTKIHRLVASYFVSNPENKPYVNHLDNNPLNNHFSNIEWCTQRENTTHGYSFKEMTSTHPGVYWFKAAKKWRARIYMNGKEVHLGYFHCELEAAAAYQNALKQLTHG